MATSERWEKLYEARDECAYLRQAVRDADLYVTCYNKDAQGNNNRLLNNGSRPVPYSVLFSGYKNRNVDPRRDPMFYQVIEDYPGPALQQMAETYPAGVQFVGSNPVGMVPFDGSPDVAYAAGESYKHSGDNAYWTNDEVDRDRRCYESYAEAYRYALNWWLLVHNLNPGSFLDYPDDLTAIIQQINIAEAGDVTQQMIIADTNPPAPVVIPATQGQYAPGDVQYTGQQVQAGMMNLDQFMPYLPYAAAGAVVLFALNRRRKKTAG